MKKYKIVIFLTAVSIGIAGCGSKKSEIGTSVSGNPTQASSEEGILQDDKDDTTVEGASKEKEEADNSEAVTEETDNQEDMTKEQEEAVEVPEHFAKYAVMLNQFIDGENAYYTSNNKRLTYFDEDNQEAALGDYSFGLIDVDKDGIEELFVAPNTGFGVYEFNMFEPADTWSRGFVGEFKYFDVATCTFATEEYGELLTNDYYSYKNKTLKQTDHYEVRTEKYFNKSYFHGMDEENMEKIDSAEYSSQAAFSWDAAPVKWYRLSKSNIEYVLNGASYNNSEDSWKEIYSEFTREWYALHGGDKDFGFKLVKLDGDDIPEICLVGNDEIGNCLVRIYSIANDEALVIYDSEQQARNASPVRLYEKSGLFVVGNWIPGVGGCEVGKTFSNGIITEYEYKLENNTKWDTTSARTWYTNFLYLDSDNTFKSELAEKTIESVEELSSWMKMLKNHGADKGVSVKDNLVGYGDINRMLGNTEPEELTDNEKYVILLRQFMNNEKCCFYSAGKSVNYADSEGNIKFLIADINADGVKELILGNGGEQYALIVAQDSWNKAYICSFNEYLSDGTLRTISGSKPNTTDIISVFDGNKIVSSEKYESEKSSENNEMKYYYSDASLNRKDISEEEYNKAIEDLNSKEFVDLSEADWSYLDREGIERALGK